MTTITTQLALEDAFLQQKQYFANHTYPSYDQRVSDLKKLKALMINNQQAFIDAMSDDFGHRSTEDTKIGDILTTVMGINYSIKHLKQWMKPEKKHIGILFQPAKGEVVYQPKGVIGIIAPWNYPVFLAFGPLTAALAAGDTAMIKMSEYTPKTNHLLAKLITETFPVEQVAIVCGEAAMAASFSKLVFDHLFFTGSTGVGKLVMKAAAENLVPVTLELGGKSPTIIDDDIDIKTAVSRLILGKTLNSGQTCVAPDYVFCPENKVAELTQAFQMYYQSMYPKVQGNEDCTAIINPAQKARIDGLLANASEQGATVTSLQPESDQTQSRKMPLTLLTNVSDDMTVMQQEIFGPLLPIIGYKDVSEAIDYINSKPRPLALYICSFNKSFQQQILLNTHAGGVCINDAAFHVAIDDLPFGGIGASGMGQYHGSEGFKTFSHGKSVLSRGKISLGSLLFPPFGKRIHKILFALFIR
ncbi:coniferyl aldehyde dehydrogenase [Colwellia hornerae]|uniref:Aldehyde dehydrogenase n=1 Tax=Colwellia hornerae TaxID=89402 RepID=A0A5C6QTZ8_9GAMM|nr:coniferyl aldehyde dehydrogenase [Colwellia hornerae]TWX56854.1 coniferyl aldehyde dehydrogenase [Colwellia hornerae]TWX62421.1 coniferyl aldehyde dehydrogenase [Colwellia hornerae]TWX72247.1 coniferyl aldehyde dehydrogenase [Colwellia hornerae]